ncbi:MAG: GH-E family nuclease [Flavobacteriaceae bacterium]|nr:GH-E family nuclease [Flavobacteriaceae bacterium]
MTNLEGEVVQHLEYVPFGEVFIESKNARWNTPYKFNAKELDEETGLYYYGARYYNPKVSLWLSVDPPLINGHYLNFNHDGGVLNTFNLGSYIYCRHNPVIYYDPDGNQFKAIGEWWEQKNGTTRFFGFMQFSAGIGEAMIGAVGIVTPEPITTVAGVVAVVHGADVASAGLKQMISGKRESSLTSQGLQKAGLSQDQADIADAIVSTTITAGTSNLLNAQIAKTVATSSTIQSVNRASKRLEYMGRNPGKDSRTGREVIERMKSEGKIRYLYGEQQFLASNGKWYAIDQADMAHKVDAILWWNAKGRYFGAKSAEVRQFMLNSDNYYLELFSINRSQGARIGQKYLPPVR